MKRLILPLLILTVGSTTCLKAPHSNKYDPQNPDKAILQGYVYEPDAVVIHDAIVRLLFNEEVIQTNTTDHEGAFEFGEIDPGVYRITADASYYNTMEHYPESLWAGVHEHDFDLYLSTYGFEDDSLNCSSPYAFVNVQGNWNISEDYQEPELHSIPNVFSCNNEDTAVCALSLHRAEASDFWFETKLKIHGSSGPNWAAGIVFRYQDIQNFYCLNISADTISFRQVRNGSEAIIRNVPYNFTTDTWFTLGVKVSSTIMKIFVEGDSMPLFLVIDPSFLEGKLGLFVPCQYAGTITSVSFVYVTIRRDLSQ